MNICTVILTRNATKELFDRVQSLKKDLKFNKHADFYIFSDEVPEHKADRVVTLSDEEAIHEGFINSTWKPTMKNPGAWDKVMCWLFLCVKKYDFAIIIEDDVFFKHRTYIKFENTIRELDSVHNGIDLVLKNLNPIPEYEVMEHHRVKNVLPGPYFISMTCVMGISRRMINLVSDFVKKNKTLAFHEIFYPTLAFNSDMNVLHDLFELKDIYWKAPFKKSELLLGERFFHPVKNANIMFSLLKDTAIPVDEVINEQGEL